jgi:hypothetical protein
LGAEAGRKVFFSEEKKQKTFDLLGVGAAGEIRDSICKSLLVLFFRKERLPSFPSPNQHRGGFGQCTRQPPIGWRNAYRKDSQ